MTNLRPLFKHGFLIAVTMILFQVAAAMVLMNLPPIRIYLYASLLALLLIGIAWFIQRRLSAKANSPNHNSGTQQ